MNTSRRTFLRASVLASPFFIGGCKSLLEADYITPRKVPASNRVNVALIGCGGMGCSNLRNILLDPRVHVVVTCDPIGHDDPKNPHRGIVGRDTAAARVDKHYNAKGCRAVADWREVVTDPTIDAVIIATPDHWHAIIAIAAMKNGKHVYCQKPLSLGISEGREMVRVAKKSGVVFQVGNQGRSSPSTRVACELVRSGYIGECKHCVVSIPGGSGGLWGRPVSHERLSKPPSYFTDEMWNLWQGPAAHWEGNAFLPGIHASMAWRWNRRYGGGMIPDFGAHQVDTVQWAADLERTGPIAIENAKFDDWQSDRELYNFAGRYEFDAVYANGFRMHVQNLRNGIERGIWFYGEKGTLFEGDGSKIGLPDHLKKWREKKDLKPNDVHLHAPLDGHSHEMDWVDGILGLGKTATDCEIGHRTISTCQLANICQFTGYSRLEWDPVAEKFVGPHASEANRFVEVPHYNGWDLG